MKVMVGQGIFMWDGIERQSLRYGYVYVGNGTYEGNVQVVSTHVPARLASRAGSRVKLTARVIESRVSGHLGDKFLKIGPVKPEDGDEILLGIGVLVLGVNDAGDQSIGLKPSDGRPILWMDPRKLYMLHDQTVELYVEETEEEESPCTDLVVVGDTSKAIVVEDGVIQICRPGVFERPKSITAKPQFEVLEQDENSSMMIMSSPLAGKQVGDQVEVCIR